MCCDNRSDIELSRESLKMEEKPSEIWKKVMYFSKRKNITKKWWAEFKKVWHIAGPAIITSVSVFSMDLVTAAFVGQLGNIELAAVSEVQNVLIGFVHGIMLGLGSALETLCGQAVGAGEFNMLGIYLQRSWIISIVTALLLTPAYIFSSKILKLLHQDPNISDLAGKYAVWIIPEIFASALNYPTEKFLQAQSKVWFMAFSSMLTLAFHVLLNWIFVTKLGMGLVGAAIAGNISYWILVVAKIIYIVCGWFPEAWTGFSFLAFKSLTKFLKLSIASAVMLCLEVWYYTAVILIVGGLKNAAIAVDSISICMNLQVWTLMVALGFSVSASVRVSNELGAGNPKAAKFTVAVNVLTSAILGVVFSVIILATKSQFPRMFSKQQNVISETSKLGVILALTIFISSIQPVLHGVAIGAGWQFVVAIVNFVCYYGLGLPIGAILGYKFNLGVQGVWSAMLGGSLLQTIILFVIIGRTNWHKETLQAEERVRTFGGQMEIQQGS
ncbi:PREDICTED: protein DETOXIFICATION 33-like [Nicotiana attenuata]|uniref:Protein DETOXIFICATION n=1 Tax=Nicotiana attenuata TaxID=49451 RepID=A0A1J6J8M8_NICAT|nr:PREDICTED: protein DETOXIFICATION 33-like [Nicotiana attenuata]OIT07171.1 protein detoxification 33 [Nicotiana attenuata]